MPLSLFGSGQKLPQGNAGQLDGNGGYAVCGGVTLLSDLSDKDGGARLRPGGLRRGKSRYTPWICFATVCLGLSKDLPPGNAMHTAPQIKTQYSQYSQYSQSAPPAVAQPTAAAMQNLSAKNYRWVMQRARVTAG